MNQIKYEINMLPFFSSYIDEYEKVFKESDMLKLLADSDDLDLFRSKCV